jgi:hypothetical protein
MQITHMEQPQLNFSLLITGTATPATVPDSNYTSKKSTLLKYEGSKSTSQLLNTWSPPGTIEGDMKIQEHMVNYLQ